MPIDHGIFRLKTPQQLLGKLERDFRVLQRKPENDYAAFNFFVTAEHLPDWYLAGRPENEVKRLKLSRDFLIVCSELANGAKHFEPRQRPYWLAEGTTTTCVASLPPVGMANARANRPVPQFVVKYEGRGVPVLDLAAEILTFWREQLRSQPETERPPADADGLG